MMTSDGHVEPVAVIGMACKFPGDANSSDSFWTMLVNGESAVGEVPPERWERYAAASPENSAVLRRTTRYGSFLSSIDGFDANFFGISPREAALMDPQQRLVLELCWEALEHGGIPPHSLAGTDTSVFIGVGTDDYGRGLLEDLPSIDAWTGIGSSICGIANRVSYALDFRGASMVVDTACSASLVALHLACQSLRLRESPLALCGGVMVMAAPGMTVALDAAGAISPDGKCKSFDSGANGYGRGEGAGILVLKTLANAQRDGDRILAVIRGSAVHQDGKTNGIMAPSRQAQEHLLRTVYSSAGIAPGTIDYLEAHGTGTPLGDAVEAAALSAVFGAERQCLVGSVKPNIGHLEAAAGVAGVIKTVLALRHGEIPPNLNFEVPNPAIPWATLGLQVVTERTPWPAGGRPRRAGVCGYGYGGTIAHVILEEAPPSPERTGGRAPTDGITTAVGWPTGVFPLSGATTSAVHDYAGRLADWLDGPAAPDLTAVGATLGRRRSPLPNRAAVVARNRADLVRGLRSLAREDADPSLHTGRALDGGLVWVFSGHGSQWPGMGRELLDCEPTFRAVVDHLDPIFAAELGWGLRSELLHGEHKRTSRIQPLIFAMQVGLAQVWRARGVRPDAVIGHSVGEIAAAVAAGVLDLDAGARLVCRRSALLDRVAGQGAMAMVGLGGDELQERLGRADVTVAILASPVSTVIAGEPEAVTEVAEHLRAQGVTVRQVESDVAFHTHHMDPLLADLKAAAADLSFAAPEIPLYSTALHDPRTDADRDGRYWAANLRNPVRLADAVIAAVEDGYRIFAEISPHPVLVHSVNETLSEADIDNAFVVHTLRKSRPEIETLLDGLGALYCHGATVDWTALWPESEPIDLPAIAWNHRRFWAESTPRPHAIGLHEPDSYTLLGAETVVTGPVPTRLWQTILDGSCRPYPGDHPVLGVEIVPAAVLLNTFLATSGRPGRTDLADVYLRVPVAVTGTREVQVTRQGPAVHLASRPRRQITADQAGPGRPEQGWLTHTTATVEDDAGTAEPTSPATGHRCTEQISPGWVIDRLTSLGVAAMAFEWSVEELHRGDGELLARVLLDETPGGPGSSWAPALDAAMSTASVAFGGAPVLRMPAYLERLALLGAPPSRSIRLFVRVTRLDTVDVEIVDDDADRVVARLTALRYGTVDGQSLGQTDRSPLLHELVWRPWEAPARHVAAPADSHTVVFVGDDLGTAEKLGGRFEDAGCHCIAIRSADGLDALRDQLSGTVSLLVTPTGPGPGESVDQASVRAAWLLARTARWITSAGLPGKIRLWCLTQGVIGCSTTDALAHAPLWGLGRVIGGEHPEIWGGVIDIEAGPAEAGDVPAVVLAEPGEDVIALTGGVPYVSRLARIERPPTRAAVALRADATYLITGGLGELGLEIARWLAGRGARRLLLVGRTALPPRTEWDSVLDPATRRRIEAVRSLEAAGVTVRVLALDVTDRSKILRLLDDTMDLPRIRGVVHAAGVVDSKMLQDLNSESLRRVMAPKVAGAWLLHELFPPGSLDFMVLFSSCGLLLGLTGQSSYAAANAFLDGLARYRRSAGDDRTVAFGWTSWRDLGMATSSAGIRAELAALGTADISAAEAFYSWEQAERLDSAYFAVLRTLQTEPNVARLPLLSELGIEDAADISEDAASNDAQFADLPPGQLREQLVNEVRQLVSAELRLAPAELEPFKPLADMGLDSVMAVAVRRGLEKRFRLRIPATLLWERPTVDDIARYLADRIGSGG